MTISSAYYRVDTSFVSSCCSRTSCTKLNYIIEENKLVLSRDYDKRVIQSDSVSTLAHGHKDWEISKFLVYIYI